MKPFVFLISILLLSSAAHAQLHLPTWKLISDQNISSFDMLTTRTGLIGIDDNGIRILAKYDNGAIGGLITTGGSITSIIIRDAATVYMTVQGEGVYRSTNGWKDFALIAPAQNSFLLAVYQTSILANFNGALALSTDGASFSSAKGILSTDTVSDAEFFSSQTAVAVTGKKLYRSLDGGRNWFVALDNLDNMKSIYIDRSHGIIYIGGSQLMKSLDSGKSWQTLTNIFFTLAGPVIGSRDCSGNFYIGPEAKTHGPLYRSLDQGRFFQEAGPAIFSSFRLKKGIVLDRGSTIFWLDSSGLLGVIRDGIDSVVTDSVRDRMVIQADSGITNSLCPNAGATQFGIAVSFDQCTGIILDSLKQVSSSPSFMAKFIPGFLNDSLPIRIAFTYHATHSGSDTAHYRLRFHSPITENIEQKFFDVIASGIPGSPLLAFTSQELNFPLTIIDSIKKLHETITNPGCDVLIIDTVFSTNPAIFIPDSKIFPLKLAPGRSLDFTVEFNPHLAGDYLESLVIRTNAGNRNITLRGTGKSPMNSSIPLDELMEKRKREVTLYPNPANTTITISSATPLSKYIYIRDLLGREVLYLQTGVDRDAMYRVSTDIRMLADGCYVLDLGGGKFERMIVRH